MLAQGGHDVVASVAPKCDLNSSERWYRWTPAAARDPAWTDVASAVARFVPLDLPAGWEAARWLTEASLPLHQSVATYLMVSGDRLDGFYAIAGSQVRLSQRHRRVLFEGSEWTHLPPTQPASLVTHMARHRDAPAGTGRHLLLHAVSIALEVAALQGNVALVLSAFDDDSADVFRRSYGFRTAIREDGGGPARLWLPLRARESAP